MCDLEKGCMQEMTIKGSDGVSLLSIADLHPAIGLVADYWVSEVMKMHSDLVGPTRTRKGTNVGEFLRSTDDFIESEGLPQSSTSGRYLGPRMGISTDGDLNLAR